MRLTRLLPGLAALLAALLAAAGCERHPHRPRATLTIHCAAVTHRALEQLIPEFERGWDGVVSLNVGGSGALLAALESGAPGDIYLPADGRYADEAQARGLAAERVPLARLRLCIGVASGNRLTVRTLDDLLTDRVRLGLPDPELAAAGRVTRARLGELGVWDAFAARVTVTKPTVSAVASDIALDAIDAALVWTATAAQFEALEAVHDPRLADASAQVDAIVLANAPQPAAASAFLQLLRGPAGRAAFAATGLEPVE